MIVARPARMVDVEHSPSIIVNLTCSNALAIAEALRLVASKHPS